MWLWRVLLLGLGIQLPCLVWSEGVATMNVLTFIPHEGQRDEVFSIEEVCGLLHREPDSEIDALVPCSGAYKRVVSGIPEVNSDVITVFVSGWAGWPGRSPYRYHGNAAYYAYLYQQAGIIAGPCVCYDHPYQQYYNASFGQRPDQDVLYDVLEKVRKTNPGIALRLVGFSYGATTILNFITQQPASYFSDVDVVMLESPFVCIEHVLQHSMDRFVWKFAASLVDFVRSFLKGYDPYMPTIEVAVGTLPQRLSIFVGASLFDNVVPYTDSSRIAVLLQERGVRQLSFYTEKNSWYRHSFLSQSPAYVRAVQSFLEHV